MSIFAILEKSQKNRKNNFWCQNHHFWSHSLPNQPHNQGRMTQISTFFAKYDIKNHQKIMKIFFRIFWDFSNIANVLKKPFFKRDLAKSVWEFLLDFFEKIIIYSHAWTFIKAWTSQNGQKPLIFHENTWSSGASISTTTWSLIMYWHKINIYAASSLEWCYQKDHTVGGSSITLMKREQKFLKNPTFWRGTP